jgi:Trk-type K+ transport system membrane component
MGNVSKISEFSPGRILLASFLFIIGLGTFLLSLPACRRGPISFIDLFFTAASATCVTGVQAVPLDNFSPLGKIVIIFLVQIGGLGLMTLSIFMVSLVLKLKLITRLMAGKLLELDQSMQLKRFLGLVVGATFFTELVGAAILFPSFAKLMPVKKAFLFHVYICVGILQRRLLSVS